MEGIIDKLFETLIVYLWELHSLLPTVFQQFLSDMVIAVTFLSPPRSYLYALIVLSLLVWLIIAMIKPRIWKWNLMIAFNFGHIAILCYRIYDDLWILHHPQESSEFAFLIPEKVISVVSDIALCPLHALIIVASVIICLVTKRRWIDSYV